MVGSEISWNCGDTMATGRWFTRGSATTPKLLQWHLQADHDKRPWPRNSAKLFCLCAPEVASRIHIAHPLPSPQPYLPPQSCGQRVQERRPKRGIAVPYSSKTATDQPDCRELHNQRQWFVLSASYTPMQGNSANKRDLKKQGGELPHCCSGNGCTASVLPYWVKHSSTDHSNRAAPRASCQSLAAALKNEWFWCMLPAADSLLIRKWSATASRRPATHSC